MPVSLDAVGHRFGDGPWLFRGLSDTVTEGEVVALVGPSGSGKSTLLSMISGWVTPAEGRICCERPAGRRGDTGDEGEAVAAVETKHESARCSEPAARIAWVFQNPHGVPGRSVLDHVALPLLAQGMAVEDAEEKARHLLDDFRLDQVAARPFKTLSGGEAQRMLLARALASAPDILLVDEPTAQLDQGTAAHVADTLTALRDRGLVVLIATHDPHVRDRCMRVIDLATYIPEEGC